MKKCKYCNKELGLINRTLKNGKVRETEYYSIKPKIINKIEYYRVVCNKCFYKKFKRQPKSPNNIHDDLIYLLDIPQKLINDLKKNGAVTLKNLQNRHGIIEGTKKFEEYKKKKIHNNSFEYKNKKYGWTLDQYNFYNKLPYQ